MAIANKHLAQTLCPTNNVWIETTKSEHGHGGPDWEFGKCLWSPARNAAGADSYALMRQPLPGDGVLHFYEHHWPGEIYELRFCGTSTIRSPFLETSNEPPLAGRWAGRSSYYRIEIGDYYDLPRPLSIKLFREMYTDEIIAELTEDQPRNYPFARYRDEVRTNQGAYLTYATTRLRRLIFQAAEIETAIPDNGDRRAAHSSYAEGQRQKRETYFFSRNPRLAAEAKRRFGYRCHICGFDFEKVYGSKGREFIECHHNNPLSERPEVEWTTEIETSVEDVTVVCANCHRMIHRRRPAYTIEEIRDAFQESTGTARVEKNLPRS